MALYVTMLTRPAFAALSKRRRVRVLKRVFLGLGADEPGVLRLDDESEDSTGSVLRMGWARWLHRASLTGTLKRLRPAQFADVLFCLMSSAGMRVVVGEDSHDVVTTGLAYVTLVACEDPEGAPPTGHAMFVEVRSPAVVLRLYSLFNLKIRSHFCRHKDHGHCRKHGCDAGTA